MSHLKDNKPCPPKTPGLATSCAFSELQGGCQLPSSEKKAYGVGMACLELAKLLCPDHTCVEELDAQIKDQQVVLQSKGYDSAPDPPEPTEPNMQTQLNGPIKTYKSK
jgi:hypothetical protein